MRPPDQTPPSRRAQTAALRGVVCTQALVGLLSLAGCGRVSVELLSLERENLCAGGACNDLTLCMQDNDADADGMPDCADGCVADPAKTEAGACGCGVAETAGDVDGDGLVDCVDTCDGVHDARYVSSASCGVGYCRTNNRGSSCAAGVETACTPGAPLAGSDTTCDGVDDDCDGQVDEDFPARSTTCGVGACVASGAVMCVAGRERDSCAAGAPAANDVTCGGDDDCDGVLDEDFQPTASACGVGVCAASGMVTCSGGVSQDSCMPRAPTLGADTTCNGVDEDCSGRVDEDYVPVVSSCGLGVCRGAGTVTCLDGSTRDSCAIGTPTSAQDGPPANDLDDDCDGVVDENACIAAPQTFAVGSYANIAVPPGCIAATVQLWGGGGGAGGQTSVGTTGTPGDGGPGGYAQQKLMLTGAFSLYVGNGGAGCGAGGVNPGAATFNGGAGGAQGQNGTAGADGAVAGGGAGATTGAGSSGARGHYGGGGGGSGALTPWPPYPGLGGGGGAASVALIGSTRALVAGGGGGGGGANGSSVASVGGPGGSGCGAAGGGASSGGGGGGGVCIGTTATRGTGPVPANNGLLSGGRAVGGVGVCTDGGGGYAIVTWGR